MISGNWSRTVVIAAGLAGFAISIALGSRHGADPMYTAGPASFGAGCTACHPLNAGPGGVEIVEPPRRYRAGQTYELNVRVFDSQQAGAGFEISAEGPDAHRGTLLILDAMLTQFAGGDPDYVTHTGDGVDESVADWSTNGGAFEYAVGWQAPPADEGPVTFFVAGNAINNGTGFSGDRFYAGYATAHYAIPGDVDADTDLDLLDFATVQTCFGAASPLGGECQFVDMDDDDFISLDDAGDWVLDMTGPTAADPGEYVLADAVRGGSLYDNWWVVAGLPEPIGEHPLYPESGSQSGNTTFRCKECHGWDYQGADGAYGTGSHFTGIAGVLGTTLSSREVFDLLLAAPGELPNGHNMAAYGLTDRDLWDLVKFVREGVVDTDDFIDGTGAFPGDAFFGGFSYGLNCIYCHGENGDAINFGTPGEPEYIGTIANDNPWELLHKIRFGHPGSPMPATELLGWNDAGLVDLGAYCQFLPE